MGHSEYIIVEGVVTGQEIRLPRRCEVKNKTIAQFVKRHRKRATKGSLATGREKRFHEIGAEGRLYIRRDEK